jgi:hypothetical protein
MGKHKPYKNFLNALASLKILKAVMMNLFLSLYFVFVTCVFFCSVAYMFYMYFNANLTFLMQTPFHAHLVCVFRHGRGHRINPTNVNYRANIWALQQAGCTHLLVTTACGSLQQDMHPADIVVIDQFIDR